MQKKLKRWLTLEWIKTSNLAVASVPLAPQSTWEADWSWIKGAAVSAVLFFLALGLRDIKTKYDKVTELEKDILRIRSILNDDQKRRLSELEDD